MPSLPQLVALVPALYLLLVAIPLTVIDLREHRLPNRIVLPVFPIALLAQGIAVALGADWLHLLLSFLIGVAVFVVGLIANYWEVLGMGDVKLASGIALVTAFFSVLLPFISIGLAFVFAFLVVIIQLGFGKAKLGQSIPLGPYLLLSFIGCLGVQVFVA